MKLNKFFSTSCHQEITLLLMRYWAKIRWLYNTDTCDNAKRLFYLIWPKDGVNGYIAIAESLKEKEHKLAELRANISELKREEAKLAEELSKERFAMRVGCEEL